MIPSRFVFLDQLPLAPSGKVDRAEIRARAAKALGRRPAPTPGVRNATQTEQLIAEIWRRLLKVHTVAPDDHFCRWAAIRWPP